MGVTIQPIQVHQLPSLPGGSQSTDYLLVEREVTPLNFVSYKMSLSALNLTSLPYTNSNYPSANTIGSALDRALVPVALRVDMTTTGTYGNGATTYPIPGGTYDFITLNMKMRDTVLPVSLPGASSGARRVVVLRILGNGDSSDGSYNGVSKILLQGVGSVFWNGSAPADGGTPGQIIVPKGATAVITLQYFGQDASNFGFSDWVGTYVFAGLGTGGSLSGTVDPQGVVFGNAGWTYVNKTTGGFFWKTTDGTNTGWAP